MEDTVKYFAGLFDADGSIGIYKAFTKSGSACYSTKFAIDGSHRPMIEAAYNFFKVGKFTTQKRHVPNSTPRGNVIGKQGWVWQANSKSEISKILSQITPYLIEKREQAEIALKFIDDEISGDEAMETIRKLKTGVYEIGDDFNQANINSQESLDPYFAGLLDGDGSIGMYGKYPKVNVAGAHKPMIKAVHDYFGFGSFNPKTSQILREEGGVKVFNKQAWVLHISAREEVRQFLSRTEPYLIEKKEQANIILRYFNGELSAEEATSMCKTAKKFEFIADGFEEYVPRRKGGLAGENNPASKFSNSLALEVRERFNSGVRAVVLAEELGTNKGTIYKLIKRAEAFLV